MKYSIFLLIILTFFIACEDKELKTKPKNPKNDSLEYMLSQAKDLNNTNLSNAMENDGVVVDGGRDKRLLDSFGMAVAKVTMEEGIYNPTCSDLSATNILTQEECEEISQKYFSYYELYGENGKKNELVRTGTFQEGMSVEEISISDDSIDYESLSQGGANLESMIDISEDESALKKLSKKLGSSDKDKELKQKIKAKLRYLKDRKENIKKEAIREKATKSENDKIDEERRKECKRISLSYNNILKEYEALKNILSGDRPENEIAAKKWDKNEERLNEYESSKNQLASELESCQ